MNNWMQSLQWLVFLALWRMSYETANVNNARASPPSFLVQQDPDTDVANQRQQEWADKAVSRYAAAQGKKWQRWNEAMFERSD